MFSAQKDNHGMDPLYRKFPRKSHYLLKVHDLPFTRSSPTVSTKRESRGNVNVEECRQITNVKYLLDFMDTNLSSVRTVKVKLDYYGLFKKCLRYSIVFFRIYIYGKYKIQIKFRKQRMKFSLK